MLLSLTIKMIKVVNLLLFVAISVTSVTAYEVNRRGKCQHMLHVFFLRQQEYDENPDYEHVKQQFMNLQAAQRSIIKKADDGPVQAAPYSTAKIQKSLNELKQGIYH